MRDVEDNPNPPPPSEQDDDLLPVPAAQTDPPPKDNGDCEDMEEKKDIIIEDDRIIIEDKRIIVETGGATLIMPAEDQLLDDQVGTGAQTPSGAVIESLSQMNMDSPAAPPVASDPPGEGQDA